MSEPATQNAMSAKKAVAALREIEQRSLAAAQRLPEVKGSADFWNGLVFNVSGVRLAAAMHEVGEMLPYQEAITRVPGARSWVFGLANVRGSLLPIIDLQVFLGGKPVVPSKATRILVVQLSGLTTGLLVPSVQGMRHFSPAERVPNARMKGALGAYVYEAFSQEGQIWPVFSLAALAADPKFRSAAR